jgi:hypothetical protein
VSSDHISNFGKLLSLNLLLSGLVIIVNSMISSVYHKKVPKCWLNCLLCNCFERNCREQLDEHPEQYDDFLQLTKLLLVSEKSKHSTFVYDPF